MLKNKKIIIIFIGFIAILKGLTVGVNAQDKVNSIEQLADKIGNENVSIYGNTIVLENDVILEDGIEINYGDYEIDLNGKDLKYNYNAYKIETTINGNTGTTLLVPSNMLPSVFYINGGNLVIKDSMKNGKIETNNLVIEGNKGIAIIESGSYVGSFYMSNESILKIKDGNFYGNDGYIGSYNSGMIQIDNGSFGNYLITSNNIIINDGKFEECTIYIEIIPYAPISKILVNGGIFTNKNDSVITIYGIEASKGMVLKGGTFITENKNKGAIYICGQDENYIDLTYYLGKGFKYSDSKQNHDTIEIEGEIFNWITYSNCNVSVVKDGSNIKDFNTVIFTDHTGKVLKTEIVEDGGEVSAPELTDENNVNKVFSNWSDDLKNIEKDKIVVPVYKNRKLLLLGQLAPQRYTGKEIKPEIKVADRNTIAILEEGKDYEVLYLNNINVGEARILVIGKGNYQNSANETIEFSIVPKILQKEENCKLEFEKEFVYTGKEIIPNMSVITKDGVVLEKDKDYKVDINNNINAGYVSVTIEGIGNYSGNLFDGFKILQKQIQENEIEVDLSEKQYTGSPITPKVKIGTLEEGKDYLVYYTNNIQEGIATVIINGTGNYTGRFEKMFRIGKTDITKITSININTSDKSYTGTAIKTVILLKDGNVELKEDIDYDVMYTNNKDCGIATVKIVGKGVYTGTITKTFRIIPKKVTITSLKNTILRCVTIKWQKETNVTGYEIYRATSENGNYSKVLRINSKLINSFTFGFQSKGTYYYKIRSYFTVNGTKIYGEFSDPMKVVISK